MDRDGAAQRLQLVDVDKRRAGVRTGCCVKYVSEARILCLLLRKRWDMFPEFIDLAHIIDSEQIVIEKNREQGHSGKRPSLTPYLDHGFTGTVMGDI